MHLESSKKWKHRQVVGLNQIAPIRHAVDVLSGIFPMQQNCSGKKNWCRMHFIGLESCIQNFCRLSGENSVRIIGIRHNIQLLLRQMENQSVVFMRNAAIG